MGRNFENFMMAGALAASLETAADVEAAKKTTEQHEQKEKQVIFHDKYGQPFAWNKRDIQYYTTEPHHTDLSKPFTGITTTGKETHLQLRTEAYQAFQEICSEFNHDSHLSPALKKIGCHVTEAFRTLARQQGIVEKFKAEDRQKGTHKAELANPVGFSEHHLGTTIDAYKLAIEGMYEWYVGASHDLTDPNFVPRIVQHGYVPTVAGEPWHFRFVGKEEAREYWKVNGVKIVADHFKFLKDTKGNN